MPSKSAKQLENKYKSIVLSYVHFCFDTVIIRELLSQTDNYNFDFEDLFSELIFLKVFLFDFSTCLLFDKNFERQKMILDFFYDALINRIKDIDDHLVADFCYTLNIRQEAFWERNLNQEINKIAPTISKNFWEFFKVYDDRRLFNLISKKIDSICSDIHHAYKRAALKK